MSRTPHQDLDMIVELIASKTSQWSDLTEGDFLKAFDYAEQYNNAPKIPVSPLPRWAFDKACNIYGVDPAAAIEEGRRYNVDAVFRGWGIVFTQRIPQSGVVWKCGQPSGISG